MPRYNSRFEGFWTDKADWMHTLSQLRADRKIDDSEEHQLRHFIEYGFVILPGAVKPELADALNREVSGVHRHSEHYLARTNRASYSPATKEVLHNRKSRLIDFHVNSWQAQQALFSPCVKRFLTLVFREELLAFQSLTFNYGSQQAIHQDGAYVVVSEPLKFAASWIALEDVREGSGELLYYPKSHRLPDFLFSGQHKSWNPKRDGQDQAKAFGAHLRAGITQYGLERTAFLPRKGDALIWAADLVHGGSKMTSDTTRRSLVTHYCPLSVNPNYRRFSGNFQTLELENGCYISARHYDLTQRLGNSRHSDQDGQPQSNRYALLRPSFTGRPRA